MDINDQAILDRVERLAFQAGVNTAVVRAQPEAQPEQEQPKLNEIERRLIGNLKVIAGECTGFTGTMWVSNDGMHNIEWADIHALVQ